MLGEEQIRFIFGLKLGQLRREKNITPAELAARCGFSVSYLNEIEKGKKYPKAEKIMALAAALDTPYDHLVSLQLGRKMAPVADLLQSGFLDNLSGIFGIEPARVIDMVSNAPAKVGAFINTLIEIARAYDMNREQFYNATLRSFQELNDNHFPAIEEAALRFADSFEGESFFHFDVLRMKDILEERFGTRVYEDRLDAHPELAHFRSFYKPGAQPELWISSRLSGKQKKFLLAKEIGYHILNLDLRSRVYILEGRTNVESFEQALTNFRASYFAGALLLPGRELGADLKTLFASAYFDKEAWLHLLKKYETTPETLMYRLTNLLPAEFGLNSLFFLRFHHEKGDPEFTLSKELHLSRRHTPHGNDRGEHYCRRWVSLKIFSSIDPGKPAMAIQHSRYVESDKEYLLISMARQLVRSEGGEVSISIGIPLTEESKKVIRFWNDEEHIPQHTVNVTCERCPLGDCKERVAQPRIYLQEKKNAELSALLGDLLNVEK